MDGKQLKEMREKLGLTQAALGEILDVKPNTVARWENGVLAVPKTIELAMQAVEEKRRVEIRDLVDNPPEFMKNARGLLAATGLGNIDDKSDEEIAEFFYGIALIFGETRKQAEKNIRRLNEKLAEAGKINNG
jgi:transcriptional regulator with XRE-family HTH domain